MLIGIPKIIPPKLLKVLMEMGHGDEIVLADGNFPAASSTNRLVRADGLGAAELLDAILRLCPLDSYVDRPLTLMQVVPGDPVKTPIWEEFASIVRQRVSRENLFEHMEKFSFYERARKAYAIIATGESAQYANIILKKGVVVPGEEDT